MDDEAKQRMKDELRQAAVDGRIPCVEALELARRLGVSPRVLGDVANEEGIKIKACQLGCF